MALDIPANTPLTDSQANLTAKIASMKNLLSLPQINLRNIPKSQQISTYDYLLEVLDSLGVALEPILNSFINEVFDTAGTFLENSVFNSVADSLGQNGILLSPYTNTPNPTEAQQTSYKNLNRQFIDGLIGSALQSNFLQGVKQQIAKDLTIMLFGPSNGPSTTILNPNPTTVNNLIQNAICAEGLYGISNTPAVTDEALEANRIKLKQQLDAGQVTYEISCQTVKIKLPQNPAFIFNGGGTFTTSSTVVAPAQSIQFLTQYVNNQVQNINNETNANKGGKTFQQTIVEKIMSYMSVLVQEYTPIVFSGINSVLLPSQQLNSTAYIFDNCDIVSDPTNTSKSQYSQTMFNSLYKELIKKLLLAVIKNFKALVANYFERLALEQERRALQKLEQQFQVFSKLAATATQIEQYTAAISTLESILGPVIP